MSNSQEIIPPTDEPPAGTLLKGGSLPPGSKLSSLLRSPELRAQIIEGALQGVQPTPLFILAGASSATYEQWRHAARTGHWRDGRPVSKTSLAVICPFLEDLQRAYAHCEARMVSRISRAADESNLKTGISEWRAASWFLEHGESRTRWFKHSENTLTIQPGPSPEQRQADSLSDDELLALADPSWQDILSPTDEPPTPTP